MENTLKDEKVLKFNISRLVMEQHGKNFRFSLFILYTVAGFHQAKKPSHTTAPLTSTIHPVSKIGSAKRAAIQHY